MARKPGSRAEDTALRLRQAALRLFAQHGYAAVSMRQIAAEVGVQAGALYQYTPDKQSLLRDLLESHMAALFRAWSGSCPPQGPAPARLEHFARFHIRFHAARADAVFLSYMELRNLEPENFARIERLRREYEGLCEAILRAGQTEGSLRVADVRLAAMAIIAMLTGVNTWFRQSGRLSLAQVEDIHCDMVLGAVGARPAPQPPAGGLRPDGAEVQ